MSEYAIYVEGHDEPVIITREKPELLTMLEAYPYQSIEMKHAIERAYRK